MIDVMFLMIIFLVLGADFDPVVSVDLPRAGGGEPAQAALRLEIRADGSLMLEGSPLPEETALESLRGLAPRSIMLLPARRLEVDKLFRWYDLLGRGLNVPVSVGVLPPRE